MIANKSVEVAKFKYFRTVTNHNCIHEGIKSTGKEVGWPQDRSGHSGEEKNSQSPPGIED
jgi:hypothetical protein